MSQAADAEELRKRVAELEARVEDQDETIRKMLPSRREVLLGGLGIAAASASTGSAVATLGADGSQSLTGGANALSQAYNVAGDLWIGPDSAKGNVNADSGRVYLASDTEEVFYGDAGSWTKMQLGGSGGALSDSGSDNSDGGDIYQLPQTEDSIDGQGGSELTDFEQVAFADAAADPSANGEVQRNGTDVKVYSGGSARNLSNIGSGGAPTDAQYVVLSTDGTLTQERTLNAGDGLALTDNGAGSNVDVTAQNVTSVTSNVTASNQDVVLADASSSALTVTLPSANTDVDVVVKKTDSSANAVTIATPNSETIDGDGSRSITGQYLTRRIVSDGSNYFIV